MQACMAESVAVFEEHACFFGLVQPSSCDVFGRCSIAGAFPLGEETQCRDHHQTQEDCRVPKTPLGDVWGRKFLWLG